MWVKSKRDGGVQFFPDDWAYTAYHMASGLFEEIPDPTVSEPVAPVGPAEEVAPASDAEAQERQTPGPRTRKPAPRKRAVRR